jgi:hypothetical protein
MLYFFFIQVMMLSWCVTIQEGTWRVACLFLPPCGEVVPKRAFLSLLYKPDALHLIDSAIVFPFPFLLCILMTLVCIPPKQSHSQTS